MRENSKCSVATAHNPSGPGAESKESDKVEAAPLPDATSEHGKASTQAVEDTVAETSLSASGSKDNGITDI